MSTLIKSKITLHVDDVDADKELLARSLLKVDDGVETRPEFQGHGVQRVMLFALLEAIARFDSQRVVDEQDGNARSILLLFEEPELFIHPQLMRRLRDALRAVAQRRHWQVVATTHSPFLVDVAHDPQSLVIMRRPGRINPPQKSQLTTDPFSGPDGSEERQRLRAAIDFHPTICEAFFASHAVLVEGDSEVAVLVHRPELYKLAGIDDAPAREVTIVSCGGKWTILPIARLLGAFKVPFRVVHDEDRKNRPDKDLAKAKGNDPYRANERIEECVADKDRIFVVKDTLEDILWTDGTGSSTPKDKPYRAWKRVAELCEDKADLSHAPKLSDLVRFVFAPFDDAVDLSTPAEDRGLFDDLPEETEHDD